MMKTFSAILVASAVLMMVKPAVASNRGVSCSGGPCQSEAREWTDSNCTYQNNCFGRCGPGCSTYFGNKTTTACKNHDQCIKNNVCGGKSAAQAHLNCLTGGSGLGNAAKSLIGAHWNDTVHKVKSNLISAWASI